MSKLIIGFPILDKDAKSFKFSNDMKFLMKEEKRAYKKINFEYPKRKIQRRKLIFINQQKNDCKKEIYFDIYC